VAGDIRQGYEDSDLRDIFIPFSQAPGRFASVLVRTDQSTLLWDQAIRGIVSKIEPYAQISPAKTIPSEDRKRAGTQFLTSMLTAFAIFALLLALLGIYGVTTYAVQQREREIAVRVAIGADRGNIVRLFLKEGSRLLAVGMGLSFIGIFGVIKVLKSRIYGVEPFDWLTLTAAFTLMAVAGLSAIWWPAKRAALKSPMIILKEG
jgi:putative ABC transport system permease protein